MASRGRGARIKGANFERELAKLFRERIGIEAQRGLAQTRGGGAEVADVHMDYLHIEAKRHKICSIKRALDQAIEDSKGKEKLFYQLLHISFQSILLNWSYEHL